MKFVHEKYESIWWISSMTGFLLILINNYTFKSDIFSIIVFVVFAVFMSIVGIMNKRYKNDYW
jgi:hypothetical protein